MSSNIVLKTKLVLNGDYGGFGLSDDAKKYIAERDPSIPVGEMNYLPRNHPLLIEAVETLGEERAGEEYAHLKVVIVRTTIELRGFDGREEVAVHGFEEW